MIVGDRETYLGGRLRDHDGQILELRRFLQPSEGAVCDGPGPVDRDVFDVATEVDVVKVVV